MNIFKDIKLENFNSIETFFFDLQKFDGLHYNQQKRIKFYKLGIICCILHQECMKMRVEKVNIYKDIEL